MDAGKTTVGSALVRILEEKSGASFAIKPRSTSASNITRDDQIWSVKALAGLHLIQLFICTRRKLSEIFRKKCRIFGLNLPYEPRCQLTCKPCPKHQEARCKSLILIDIVSII